MANIKQLFFLLTISLFIWACSAQKKAVKVGETETKVELDSIEYGVETFDGKFEAWYAIHNNPANYRSEEYYANWNKQYVMAWNNKATSGSKNSFFEPIVGYDSTEEYGFDVNHKLFYYFQYVENVLNIEIMPGGPKAVQN